MVPDRKDPVVSLLNHAQLQLSMTRAAGTADISYRIERSTNLQEWSEATPNAVILADGAPGQEEVIYEFDADPTGYWRIHTTLN